MNYPSLVSLREVAPRDGWQKFKTVLPTEVKRELICSMIDYGAVSWRSASSAQIPYVADSTWIWSRSVRRCSPMPQRGESR